MMVVGLRILALDIWVEWRQETHRSQLLVLVDELAARWLCWALQL